MSYCIWIVHSPNDPVRHTQCFNEVALGLQSAFRALGMEAPIVERARDAKGTALVLGPHLLAEVEEELPQDMILFNLEQLEGNHRWFAPQYRYLEFLRRYPVWDYSRSNIAYLETLGVHGAVYCPIGYAPELTRIPPAPRQDIDVLLVGTRHPRRAAVIQQLVDRGAHVHWITDKYGPERDAAIARSKIVINIHLYAAKLLEVVRLSYLVSNGKCVISERGGDAELEAPYEGAVAFCDYDRMAEECMRHLRNDALRREQERKALEVFRKYTQAGYLEVALSEHRRIHSSAVRPRIFVAIPSYRDAECQWTVKDLFERAIYPERVYIGICWQADKEKDAECFHEPYARPGQVREIFFKPEESKGANWARAQALSLMQGEEYVLLIDAHMRAEQGWDEMLLSMSAQCESGKPVITGWLPGYCPPDVRTYPENQVPRAYISRADMKADPQMLHQMYRLAPRAEAGDAPVPAGMVIQNFIFAPARAFAEVPIDPHIAFWGDEINLSARLWTHGWDFFQYSVPPLYHYWDRKERGEYRDKYAQPDRRSLARNRHLFGLEKSADRSALAEIERYGLGGARPLAEYRRYLGVDAETGAIAPHAAAGKWEISASAARPRIFVAIASYKDAETRPTVNDLFAKAEYPGRVSVGICWQADREKDAACFAGDYAGPEQVREVFFAPEESKGANWARAQALSLMQGEEYVLLIDAHMRFAEGWDETFLQTLAQSGVEKAIATVFPCHYDPPDAREPMEGKIPLIRVNHMGIPNSAQLVHLMCGKTPEEEVTRPVRVPFIVNCCVFAPAAAFREVPLDPEIYFYGDEISLAARLWTHGWNVFQPMRPAAWHHWPKDYMQSAHYKAEGVPPNRRSVSRVKQLLRMERGAEEFGRYGLGKSRSLESFWRVAGIDVKRWQADEAAKSGAWHWDRERDGARPRIFITIAAYRDPELRWTLEDMFEKAAAPERLAVAILWQRVPGEDDALFLRPYPRAERLRVMEMDARESRGVCWARAELQRLWRGEEFTLQIDSHMRFEPGWDETLIRMHRQIGREKAVLTTYPSGYTPPRNIEHRLAFRLVAKQFDEHGIFTMTSRPMGAEPPPPKPVLGAFAGACMLFGPGSMIRDVPYDPYLYFFGEEISLSARLWTHGYDIYHPNLPVMYHYWERSGRRTHFDDHRGWQQMNERSFARVRHLLGTEVSKNPEITRELNRYGLGNARSLEEYQRFSGVDFARRQISPAAHEGRFIPLPPPRSGPRRVLETEDVVVFDNFVPEEIYEQLYAFAVETDYQYINTHGKVQRVWDISSGFPLRSEKNAFYYADPAKRPPADYNYPTRTPFDLFIDYVNAAMPSAQHIVGSPVAGWEHFSVSAWLYPAGTGLSLHDDGSGVYSGAYVYFMSPEWKPHWGGLLMVMERAASVAIQQQKMSGDPVSYHKRKWLHVSDHNEIAMEHGIARCIMPKRNRMVFLRPDAFHMVTKVQPECGDNVRMSLAGFFHRGGPKQQ